MAGFAIGKSFKQGVPGMITRSSDNQVNVYPNKGDTDIKFGTPVVRSSNGVVAWASTSSIDNFIGIAVRIVKTNKAYAGKEAVYEKNAAVDVLTRGGIAVVCTKDATATTNPSAGGKVYIRKATGAFVAAAEGTGGADTVEVPNAKWATGTMDSDGVTEITLLQRRA